MTTLTQLKNYLYNKITEPTKEDISIYEDDVQVAYQETLAKITLAWTELYDYVSCVLADKEQEKIQIREEQLNNEKQAKAAVREAFDDFESDLEPVTEIELKYFVNTDWLVTREEDKKHVEYMQSEINSDCILYITREFNNNVDYCSIIIAAFNDWCNRHNITLKGYDVITFEFNGKTIVKYMYNNFIPLGF